MVLDLCATLAARGHDVTLFTCDPADVPSAWLAGEPRSPRVITLDRLSRFTKLLPRRSLSKIAEVLRGLDVLHLHGPWEVANLQYARLARRINLPYLVTLHGTLDDWPMAQQSLKKQTFLSLAGRRLLERAAAVQCTASAELEQASKRFGRARGVVLPCLMDLAPFENLPGNQIALAAFPDARTDLPKVLFLSRLHPVKRLEILIESAALLRDRGRPILLLIAGTGDAEYVATLRRLVASLRLDDHVKFLGMVGGVEKVSLYQLADVFVHPSSQENFGLVLPEAMAARTPVITTRSVGIWRDIQSVGAAIVDPVTPATLADAIDEILRNPVRRSEIARDGRRWVFETLSPDRLLARYEALYAEVADARRPAISPSHTHSK